MRPALRWIGLFLTAKAILIGLRAADGAVGEELRAPLFFAALLFEDVLVALALGIGEVGAAAALPPRAARWAARGFAAIFTAGTIYVALNVPVGRVLGTPLTYAMLGAAGGALADSLRLYVTLANLLAFVAVLAAGALSFCTARVVLLRMGIIIPIIMVLCALLVIGPLALRRVETRGLHRNPLLTIARTALAHHGGDPERSLLPPPPLPPEGEALDLRHLGGAARGRSVIWTVLESTAARYLAPYGAAADPMPHLGALAKGGLLFESIYAAYPESIKGLFSMLCARSPAPHTGVERYTEKALPCEPIAKVLAGRGYLTALYHSGWFLYLGMQGIVAERGFTALADAGAIRGAHATSFGVDEAATVARVLSFIDETRRAGRPFFIMYLPITGHHPYESPGPAERPRPFGVAREIDRYRNDLRLGDDALGALIEGVRARGLLGETLWVISGDHGEAFHQHPGNFAHTLHLYEENVHVPLVIAAPFLPGGARRVPQVGSVIDIAPTILDLLGVPIPARYQGRSLLSPNPGAARFYTDHAVLRLGLRHGRHKFILDAESGRSELFDLLADPAERIDLSARDGARAARYRAHLTSWAARQRALVHAR